ncbi:hypothetical protein FZEAL_1395 [Fusarium zealandicum]|uniref:Uncharacterized protein n=1 Tax=Fusarium zealandicum TaxID=1053134 RepID=A0A8H4UT37_9HYPO|nr:hypothetical protein FZEAL_1395 [Fusarium zealandicum]
MAIVANRTRRRNKHQNFTHRKRHKNQPARSQPRTANLDIVETAEKADQYVDTNSQPENTTDAEQSNTGQQVETTMDQNQVEASPSPRYSLYSQFQTNTRFTALVDSTPRSANNDNPEGILADPGTLEVCKILTTWLRSKRRSQRDRTLSPVADSDGGTDDTISATDSSSQVDFQLENHLLGHIDSSDLLLNDKLMILAFAAELRHTLTHTASTTKKLAVSIDFTNIKPTLAGDQTTFTHPSLVLVSLHSTVYQDHTPPKNLFKSFSKPQFPKMSTRRDLVERDFEPRIILRAQVPVEHAEEPETSPTDTSTSSASTANTGCDLHTSAVDNTQADDRSATVSPPITQQNTPFPPQGKSGKRRRSDESQPSSKESPTLPPGFPPCPMERPDRAALELWRQGCREVQRQDGTVDGFDVATWLLARKGGAANPWMQLGEGRRAIESMRKETIDFQRIVRQREEDDRVARLKEERRLANKLRYRPRGQIAKEKAERRAAAAAKKAEEEAANADKESLRESIEGDIDGPQAKKVKMDGTSG